MGLNPSYVELYSVGEGGGGGGGGGGICVQIKVSEIFRSRKLAHFHNFKDHRIHPFLVDLLLHNTTTPFNLSSTELF